MELNEHVLTEQHVDQLSQFFNENTEFSFVEFLGYLVGVASAPRTITTTEWQNFFLGEAAFQTPEQEAEMRDIMELVYATVTQELKDESYDSSFFAELEDPEFPAEDTRIVLLQWLTGYWLGLEIGGQEWTNSGLHEDSIEMLCVIDEVGEQFEEDERRVVTAEDIQAVQENVKAFFDYWQGNCDSDSSCGELEDAECEPFGCDTSDCMPTDCAPTDCKPKSENKSRCC